MVHGMVQDPLRSVLAFKMFGRSIGASRTLESILKIVTYALMGLLVLRMQRNNLVLSLLTFALLFATLRPLFPITGETALGIASKVVLLGFSLFFFCHSLRRRAYGFILPAAFLAIYLFALSKLEIDTFTRSLNVLPRDITTFTWLLSLTALHGHVMGRLVRPTRLWLAAFLFSFVPFASLVYSVDRGAYLTIIYALLFPSLYFLFFRNTAYGRKMLFCSGLGVFLGLALIGMVIRDGFVEFVRFAFLTLPRYYALLDGRILTKSHAKFLLPTALGTFWFVLMTVKGLRGAGDRISTRLRAFLRVHLDELGMWLVSVVYLRSILHRPDINHLSYTALFSYLFLFCMLTKYFFAGYLQEISYAQGEGGPLRSFTAAFIAAIFVINSSMAVLYHREVIEANFPLHVHDDVIVPEDYQEAAAFIKQNLEEGERFLTLTSEASWYYLLDVPCPIRFLAIALAAPYFYQEEVVEDLQNKPVKFILYSNDNWANRASDMDNHERLPVIMEYIDANYIHYRYVGSNDIWIRKDFLSPGDSLIGE
ncbi:MAG: hypothetical protein QME88_06690 [Actinomycetota bacterium]|nr:hypothetical protein [Actinomycetota bacterium]